MFLSQEDVEAVSANATAATTVLRQLDLELVSPNDRCRQAPILAKSALHCSCALTALLGFYNCRGTALFLRIGQRILGLLIVFSPNSNHEIEILHN